MQEGQEPGQVIIPHPQEPTPVPVASAPAPQQPSLPIPQVNSMPEAQPVPPVALPQPQVPQQAAPAPYIPEPIQPAPQTAEPASGWQFNQEADSMAPDRDEPLPDTLSWTAAEFIAHDKGIGWYGALALGGIVATVLIYFLTKDKFTAGVVIFALVAFGAFAGRKPREEQYALNSQGIQVGQRMYAFHDFKTFSVADEGGAASIMLMPLKRFMPPLTLYVTKEVEDQAIDFLSFYLPFSEHKADAVDGLLRRIRF
jgi:hypothetical protein